MMLLLALACALSSPPSRPEAAPPPAAAGPSLYALDLPLRTQSGAAARLDLARGHPTILSMFYTTCPMACPLLIQDIQSIEATLDPAAQDRLRVVLLSFDPAHDDTAALAAAADRNQLDPRWTLGAVPADEVRTVAAALGVAYRPLPEGGFTHTAVLTLVDGDGVIRARAEGSDGRDALLATLRALTAAPSPP